MITMNILKLATSGILGTLMVSGFVERQMNNPDIETIEPIDTVSIIVPSFNEEPFIKKCLSSIKGQSIIQEYPQCFELILVDSGSADNTVAIAEQYVDKIITTTVRGKLTARNLAIDQAKGNIIVNVDSDSYYNPFWLNTLLKPFNNLEYDNLVCVVGSTYDQSIPGVPTPIRNIAEFIDRNILTPKRIVSRNSAFWKHDFYQVGKFDETINQMNVHEMMKEEEYGFGEKLSKLGKVVFKMNANCVHLGGQKIGCRTGTVDRQSCQKYGINIERFG
jgi:glycosyltransferase involved in cell wall biosynthesis